MAVNNVQHRLASLESRAQYEAQTELNLGESPKKYFAIIIKATNF